MGIIIRRSPVRVTSFESAQLWHLLDFLVAKVILVSCIGYFVLRLTANSKINYTLQRGKKTSTSDLKFWLAKVANLSSKFVIISSNVVQLNQSDKNSKRCKSEYKFRSTTNHPSQMSIIAVNKFLSVFKSLSFRLIVNLSLIIFNYNKNRNSILPSSNWNVSFFCKK